MASTQAKPLLPQLRSFYDWAEPLAIVLRGGGPYSLDRKIGKEL